jgi:hypothetical protein
MERPYANSAVDELIAKEAETVSGAQNVASDASDAASSYSSASACRKKGKRHNPSVTGAKDKPRVVFFWVVKVLRLHDRKL